MTSTDELLERVAAYFTDARHWMKAGWYNDDHSQYCLVGAIDFLGQKYELPTAPVKWLIFDVIDDEQDKFYMQLYNVKDIDWFIINYNDRSSQIYMISAKILLLLNSATSSKLRQRRGRRGASCSERKV